MLSKSFRPILLVWLALMIATAMTWTLGAKPEVNTQAQPATAATILLIALIKVRLVMQFFMEVRHAPLPLRFLCDGWIVVVGASMIGIYFWYL